MLDHLGYFLHDYHRLGEADVPSTGDILVGLILLCLGIIGVIHDNRDYLSNGMWHTYGEEDWITMEIVAYFDDYHSVSAISTFARMRTDAEKCFPDPSGIPGNLA